MVRALACASVICPLTAGIGGGCVDAGDPAQTAAVAEIKNGIVWDPWIQDIQTWTRNVVRVSTCTGTLLDYEWVLSAGHCFDAGQDPSSIAVRHTLADGSVEQSVGAELLVHPQAGVDVALVRLAEPMHPGVDPLPMVGGSTADLVGETVFCAGYGATDTGAACTSSAECGAGEFCRYGACMTANDGRLRAASFQIIADHEDPSIYYQFQVPNALGQLELPGDSGSSCWNGHGLTGVHKAGNPTNYNRHTSGPAARAWIESIVTPPVPKQVNQPGAYCKPVGSASLDYGAHGEIMNSTAGSISVVCPMMRPIVPFTDLFSVPRLFVQDRNPTADVCCAVQSKNANGALVRSASVCSEGSGDDFQAFALPSVNDSLLFSHASILCTLPPSSGSARSGIFGYRAQLANR